MSTTQLIVRSRPVLPRDYERVHNIAAACLSGTDLVQFAEDLQGIYSGRFFCAVAYVCHGPLWEGPVAGFIYHKVFGDGVHVGAIAVLLKYRRRGIGSHLLGHAKARMRGDRKRVQLHVPEEALPAQLMLKSEGFRCTEIIQDPWGCEGERYWFEFRRGIDDVAMARSEWR